MAAEASEDVRNQAEDVRAHTVIQAQTVVIEGGPGRVEYAGSPRSKLLRFTVADFADLARRALRDRGYSVRDAAHAIDQDPGELGRILAGVREPSTEIAKDLDGLVGAGGALAGTLMHPDDSHRVARAAGRPSRMDAGTVEATAGVLAALRRLDDSARPEAVLPATLVQLAEVTRMLKEARGPHRDAFAAVASEFVQFGGWLLAELRRDGEAVQLLDDAVDLADEIGNGTLAAQALNFKGYLARQQGRQQAVARWFTAAAYTPGAHPAQRLGDLLQAAAGLGHLGKRDEALRMLDEGARLMDEAGKLPPPATAYWLTPEFSRLSFGLSALALGRYDEAADHLRNGLAGLPEELRGAAWNREYVAALEKAEAAR